jgi:DNA-binding XRE family transcriptional regulator
VKRFVTRGYLTVSNHRLQRMVMNPEQYKAEREKRGTQEEVAAKLGVSRVTLARRETGTRPVSRECFLALLSLPKRRKTK